VRRDGTILVTFLVNHLGFSNHLNQAFIPILHNKYDAEIAMIKVSSADFHAIGITQSHPSEIALIL
jgi:hypothetical protein